MMRQKLNFLKILIALMLVGLFAVLTTHTFALNGNARTVLLDKQGIDIGQFFARVSGNETTLTVSIEEPFCFAQITYLYLEANNTVEVPLEEPFTFDYSDGNCTNVDTQDFPTPTPRNEISFVVRVTYIDSSINDGVEPLPQTATMSNIRYASDAYWNFDLDGQTYLSWCVGFNQLFYSMVGPYTVEIQSLEDQTLIPQNVLGPVLWLTANAEDYPIAQVQYAIWNLLGVSIEEISIRHSDADAALIASIVNDAREQGSEFMPTCGREGYSGVILIPLNTYSPEGNPAQPLLFPILVPCDEPPLLEGYATVTIKKRPITITEESTPEVTPDVTIDVTITVTIVTPVTPIIRPASHMVAVCHKSNEIDVDYHSVQAHVNHGDFVITSNNVCNDDGHYIPTTEPPPTDEPEITDTPLPTDESNHKLTICHNGNVIEVDQHSVEAHLNHGDFVVSADASDCDRSSPHESEPTPELESTVESESTPELMVTPEAESTVESESIPELLITPESESTVESAPMSPSTGE